MPHLLCGPKASRQKQVAQSLVLQRLCGSCSARVRDGKPSSCLRPAMALGAPDSDARQREAECESGDAAWLEGPGSKWFKTSAISPGLKP